LLSPGEAHRSKVLGDLLDLDGLGGDRLLGDLAGHPPADGSDLALQIAQTGLPGVAGDDMPQGAAGEGDLLGGKPVGRALRGIRCRSAIVDLLVLGGSPATASTSMRSRRAGGTVSRILAVAMNMVLDRSNGTSR